MIVHDFIGTQLLATSRSPGILRSTNLSWSRERYIPFNTSNTSKKFMVATCCNNFVVLLTVSKTNSFTERFPE